MSDVTISIKDDGPFLVKGDVSLADAEGNQFDVDKETIALCRCGTSTNQPFCSGNHKKIGFESAPRAAEQSQT